MNKSIVSEGKTTAEAVEKGLKELKVSKDKVEIKVLEEEKRSFYSILTPRIVKVELTLKEEVAKKENNKKENDKKEIKVEEKPKRKVNQNENEINEAVKGIEEFLNNFLDKDSKYMVQIKDFEIYVDINGEFSKNLIGYRGETINAFQTVLTSIANKKSSDKIRIFLDIEGYRSKREKTLEELAEKIARTVIRTGKEVVLEPMTAYERKVIHSKLQDNNKIQTFSKGEEPYRKVVITLK